jgi:hypothetical protein
MTATKEKQLNAYKKELIRLLASFLRSLADQEGVG